MLDALEAYLAGGGRLMYLGGNGFYWVTGMDAEYPHVVEVRRGYSGTKSWESAPGEVYQTTSGEPGGLWRYRGRNPNKLTGVGFAAQGWGGAAGYQRLEASRDPRAAWVFEGIGEDEIIGEFGHIWAAPPATRSTAMTSNSAHRRKRSGSRRAPAGNRITTRW